MEKIKQAILDEFLIWKYSDEEIIKAMEDLKIWADEIIEGEKKAMMGE